MNPVNGGITSIILVTYNQLEYTKLCVESIQRLTTQPYEFIVVDNGSTDGTVEWVKSLGLRVESEEPEMDGDRLSVIGPARVTVIANVENRGFPAAANQGIRAARGQHILLLNNDTILTHGWLSRLLRALRSDPGLGMVGPVSNFVSGSQQIEVPYGWEVGSPEWMSASASEFVAKWGSTVHEFARAWGEANDGRMIDVDRLVGFCLLMNREVVDKIGLLDERFGIGNFEDDDLCRRAREAGFRLAIAADSFVHHFGGRTFLGAKVDHGTLMRRNEQLYREKWKNSRESRAAGREPEEGGQSSFIAAAGTQLSALNPQLSLCMIARDNERTIAAALEGIRPHVDEMIVVDTGSTDRTAEIAAGIGARVFHFPWCDDFSAARNESIRHALGQWVFWMDTDDIIDADNARKIPELVSREIPPTVLGFLMKVRCPSVGENGDGGFVEVDQVKLFRNLPHLRFELRIHEQILMSIRRAGGTTAWTDIFVVHANADTSPEGRAKKLERDLRILQLDHQEHPDHPFVLFNMGMTYAEAGRHEEAIGFLWQSIGRSGDDDSHLRKAFAFLVSNYRHVGRHLTAWETCLKGLKQFPDDPELRFRQATMLGDFANLPDAARAFEDLLMLQNGRHLSSVDRAIQGYRARQNLAAVYTDMGEFAKAEEQWRRVVEEVPNDRAFRERHCRLLFEHFAPSVAEPAFRELIARNPQNAAALHNLGSILYKLGRFDEGTAVYRQSLELRPDCASTYLHLGYALREAGKLDDAVATWEKCLTIEPGNSIATEELDRIQQKKE